MRDVNAAAGMLVWTPTQRVLSGWARRCSPVPLGKGKRFLHYDNEPGRKDGALGSLTAFLRHVF